MKGKQEIVAEMEKAGFKNNWVEGDPVWTRAHNENLNMIAYLLAQSNK